jgi:hypothetical protein
MSKKCLVPFVVFLFFFGLASKVSAENDKWIQYDRHGKWFASLCFGLHSTEPFGFGLLNFQTDDQHLLSIALGKEIVKVKKYASLEVEGLLTNHFGNLDFQEYILSLNLRYHYFPWDNHVKTSVAFCDGVSYSSKLQDNLNKHLMNYVGIELTAADPRRQNIQLVYRLHHRSGPDSQGYIGESNYHTLGIRYNW